MTELLRTNRSRAQKLVPFLRAFAVDPLGVARALPGELRQKRGTQQYSTADADEAWYEHLHEMLGAAWPCPDCAELDILMEDISAVLAANGLRTGRGTYGWYSDAEKSLCGAIWCVVRHARPQLVIETGVAHGVSSRVVLEALGRNERGHLYSIDLPHPLDHRLHGQTGLAVSESCRGRWTYLAGSSQRRLPPLLAEVDEVNVFIHDSLHTAENTLFEMEQVALKMPPGGVMLVDDIMSHNGFATFAGRHPDYQTMVCSASDQEGMFGIAVNFRAT
jgi:Methyltransferase domain